MRRLFLALLLSSAACGGPKVEVQQLASTAGKTTIGFGGRRPAETGFESAELPEQFRDLARRTVRDVLITKGYSAAIPPAEPDLLMYVGVGRRARKVTDAVLQRDPFLPDFIVDEGSIVFDVFAGEELIYRSAVQGALKKEPDPDRFAIALRKALQDFPPADSAAPSK
ncbi:MAG: hypothetical protein AAGD10_21865 [Myxococcota bacterium]